MNKRSQVTIFIIIAVVIVAVILFFFLFPKIKPGVIGTRSSDVESTVETCIRQEAQNISRIMMSQGGYVNPENYKLYEENKVQYLCYISGFYKPCINQEPVLIEHFESELKNYLEPRIESCFRTMKAGLEDANYNVNMGEMSFQVEAEPNLIRIKIERVIETQKNSESKRFEDFTIIMNSPVYNLLRIAQKIINGEAEECEYDYVSHMMFYPDYDIRKFVTGDSSKIYTIKEKYSGSEFKFAVRSCVIPPGF